MIKHPDTLAEIWLRAVIRQNQPLTWKEVKDQYWEVLMAIPTTAEVMQVSKKFL